MKGRRAGCEGWINEAGGNAQTRWGEFGGCEDWVWVYGTGGGSEAAKKGIRRVGGNVEGGYRGGGHQESRRRHAAICFAQ